MINTKNKNKIYSKLGSNEKAIVDKIKSAAIKNIVINIIGIKLKLQWTGWLQYLMPVPIILGILIISMILYFVGITYFAFGFFIIGTILFLKAFFDIITIKFKFRFPETKPKSLENENIFELLKLRHSCRSYQLKKLTKNDLNKLMKSIEKYLKEPKFSSEPIRIEYISATINVWPVVNATEFLVAIAPKEYNRLSVMDVGSTLQKIVIDATRIGIGTCWIGPGADHKSITQQLGDRFNLERENIICICAVGYESKYTPIFIKIFNNRMRRRLPIKSLFFSNYKMNKSIEVSQGPYNNFKRILEGCQWAPSSYNGQTTRGIISIENSKITHIDFLAVTQSRYYAAVASGIWCANWEMGCNALNIKGHFERLEKVEIDLKKEKNEVGFPVYDMSWVLTKSIEQE